MIHYLYIIFSKSSNIYYVGETHNCKERVQKHNNHSYEGAFSKIATDWELVLTFSTNSKEDALYLEKFIKRMKSRKFIEKIILDNTILNDILAKK